MSDTTNYCPECVRLTAERDKLLAVKNCAVGALFAIERLIDDKPMLAAKMAGSTTLGNTAAELRGSLMRLQDNGEQ